MIGRPFSAVVSLPHTNGEPLRGIDASARRNDGRAITISLRIAPIHAPNGRIAGAVYVARDPDTKARDLRAAKRLAAIVESSDDAIVSKDLNGIVMSWNIAAERMFGYSAAEIIGKSIRTVIPDERQTEEDDVLARIRRGDRIDHFETIRKRKDGTQFPIALTVSPILDDNGRVVGASKIARDISDRKRLEEERGRLLAQAESTAATTERLNQFGIRVAAALDRDTVLQAVTDAGTELTTAAFGAFFYNVADENADSYMLYTLSGDASPIITSGSRSARRRGRLSPWRTRASIWACRTPTV